MMPWNTAQCYDKTIWSLWSLFSDMFQVPQCTDHLLENVFTVWLIYYWWHIAVTR